nr:hypothetical protein [Tanacetum cinerariifolium]
RARRDGNTALFRLERQRPLRGLDGGTRRAPEHRHHDARPVPDQRQVEPDRRGRHGADGERLSDRGPGHGRCGRPR